MCEIVSQKKKEGDKEIKKSKLWLMCRPVFYDPRDPPIFLLVSLIF